MTVRSLLIGRPVGRSGNKEKYSPDEIAARFSKTSFLERFIAIVILTIALSFGVLGAIFCSRKKLENKK